MTRRYLTEAMRREMGLLRTWDGCPGAVLTKEAVVRAINAALEDAKRAESLKDEPVNWADLRVASVEKKVIVVIEEAAPEATRLREYIRSRLLADGIDPEEVEIILEW